jgi:thioredoxin reductase (NADPH)
MDAGVNVAVIGAGPAGIAAGIFLQRAGLDPLLLEKGELGGLLRNANLVENYPGFPSGIVGGELVERFSEHLRRVGLEVTRATVMRANPLRGSFEVATDSGKLTSKALIVASGTMPSEIRLKGHRALMNKSVFDEITQVPAALRRNRRAVVIGGGDAAFDYALNLIASGNQVAIVSRSKPSCLSLLRDRAEARGVEILVGWTPESVRDIRGGVELRCRSRAMTRDLKADFVLTACGRVQNIDFLAPSLRRSIGENPPPETSVPGFYVAGDVAHGNHRQTGIAVGDGIRAAMLAQDFLKNKEGPR